MMLTGIITLPFSYDNNVPKYCIDTFSKSTKAEFETPARFFTSVSTSTSHFEHFFVWQRSCTKHQYNITWFYRPYSYYDHRQMLWSVHANIAKYTI